MKSDWLALPDKSGTGNTATRLAVLVLSDDDSKACVAGPLIPALGVRFPVIDTGCETLSAMGETPVTWPSAPNPTKTASGSALSMRWSAVPVAASFPEASTQPFSVAVSAAGLVTQSTLPSAVFDRAAVNVPAVSLFSPGTV